MFPELFHGLTFFFLPSLPFPPRRKKSLKYHPDKAGKDFDAAKWQEFERARDVLSDAEARTAYDSARSAALLREAQRHAMDAKRRAMIEDLEARERGIKRPRHHGDAPGRNENAMSEEEKQRLIAAGRRRREERERLMREAEERDRLREKEKEKEKKQTEQEQSAHRRPPPPPERDSSSTTSKGGTTFNPLDTDTPMADAVGGGSKDDNNQDGDEYDARIADIERRLQERQAKKAARKEAKKNKNAQGGRRGDEKAAQDTPSPTTQPPGITESKADHQKAPSPASASAPTPAPSKSEPKPSSTAAAAAAAVAAGPRPPRAPGDFSSTMARLRAAQAAKDAKRKAEQEAAAASGANSSPVS